MPPPHLRLSLLLALCGAPSLSAAEGPLHVASPDWRDQVVYFAMIDRFDDGDASNNDQGAGEYDPRSGAHYSGGDLAGLERRLDYIRGLGATALWTTPPVAHQWWDGEVRYGGYHGYWAEDFSRIDAHFGDADDYARLARALHARGMYLVQDVVVNHVGNYFEYPPGDDGRDAGGRWRANRAPGPRAAPTQWPFSRNDARDPAQRALDVYHWTPAIADYADPRQQQSWQLASLDDLNTHNPLVRRALRASYGDWIARAGVDALRIDTAFYVEPAFFRDFLDADDARAPGVRRVAAATGRRDLLVFGEGFGIDPPYAEAQSERIEAYARDAQGDLLPSMLNFPLYGSLLDVFARGTPAGVLGHRIEAMQRIHARPSLMPTFVDNHDVARFLAEGDEAALRQALLLIHALPGIPVVYYGTEQGFREPRAAMFAAGHGAGGVDHFDVEAPLYRYLQRVTALRHAQPTLRRGHARVLEANAAAPGALLYAMRDGAQTLLVAFNSASHATLAASVATGLPSHARLVPLFSIDGDAPAATLDAQARLTLALPPRAGYVWRVDGAVPTPPGVATTMPTLGPVPARVDDLLEVHGHAAPGTRVALVVDGDLGGAQASRADADGRYAATLATDRFVDSRLVHRLVAWSAADGVASAPREFRVDRRWRVAARADDPAGDDRGPHGRYDYPLHADWRAHRPGDLRALTVSTSGGSLRITVRLQDVISRWNAPHDFDHVALTAFVELPGRAGGARVMPLQHDVLPGDLRWHYRLRVSGWTHALFAADGASATHEGRVASPGAALAVDRERDSLTLTLPASALGDPPSLRGARVWITTWDYDGGYRALAPQPAAFVFGGGDGARDPLWLDASAVLTLQ